MERFISSDDGFRIEHAVNYLVSEYGKSGRNPKPVLLHSLRIGMYLLELGYDTNIIIVGILHDLVEDSDVTINDIKREFGADIANWVGAVSYMSKIKDPVKQYREMFVRTVAAGKISVVVKAADLHINSLYIRLVPDTKKQRLLLGKIEYFLAIARAFKREPVMQMLNDRYRAESSRIEKIK